MSPELFPPLGLPAEKTALTALMNLVEKSSDRKGRIDLVTFTLDHLNGSKHTFSPIGLEFCEELDGALDQVVLILSDYTREGVEGAVETFPPKLVKEESHLRFEQWEFALTDGRFLGVETVVDPWRKEEWARTWYISRPGKSLKQRFQESPIGEAVAAKARQVLVGLEYELPPHTSTIEEFPRLPLGKAIEAIRRAREDTPLL